MINFIKCLVGKHSWSLIKVYVMSIYSYPSTNTREGFRIFECKNCKKRRLHIDGEGNEQI